VPSTPRAGEFVSPRAVAVGTDGTIYVVDSDGTFGSITALSRRAAPQRVGSTALVPGEAVHGWLDEQTAQQAWTYEGRAGDRLTVSGVEVNRTGELDVALHLIAPDGSEEAYNDDQLGLDLFGALDSQIAGHTLEASGTYTVIVERVAGRGMYSLGINPAETVTLNLDGVTRLEGLVADAIPTKYWQFDGQAGQTLTVTMRRVSGSLDPFLKLNDLNGDLLAWNDDAADPELGQDAQIVLVELRETGTYTLEATRYDGAGRYSLVIVVNQQ
jgi:hypothetical protein